MSLFLAARAALGAGVVPLDVPVLPDGEQGRRWAREELAGPGYERPGLVRRVLEWVFERLQSVPMPDGSGSALLGGVVVLLVAAVVVWALVRAGGPLARRRAAAPDDVFEQRSRSAAEYRAAADRAAAAGDWRTAVIERFRALVRGLEENGVLPEQPGRTADETARTAGVQLPAVAVDLHAAARLFDDVRYGDRDASEAADTMLRRLDDHVRRARQGRLRSTSGGAR